jgi:hypothetical protein
MHFCRCCGITRVLSLCNVTRTKQIIATFLSHYPIYFTYRHQSGESNSTASYLLASHRRETDLTPASCMSDLWWKKLPWDRLCCDYFGFLSSVWFHRCCTHYQSHITDDVIKSHTPHTHTVTLSSRRKHLWCRWRTLIFTRSRTNSHN